MSRKPISLPLLALVLTAGTLAADEALLASKATLALVGLQAQRELLGLDQRHGFALLNGHEDLLGYSHVRFQQCFQGVPVWGGQVITHRDASGRSLPLTDGLLRAVQLNVRPSLPASEALALVHADLAPRGPYACAPVAALVIYPIPAKLEMGSQLQAMDRTRKVERCALAYHVHTQLENGAAETAHTDYLIDAHSGAILKKWATLRTEAALGSGITQFNGTVRLDTDRTAKGFALLDWTRGQGGTFKHNAVTNLDHDTSGDGTLYANPGNTWGDGLNYTDDSVATTGATGQTAAADAAYGLQVTWDMYKQVFKRNGIDGKGKATHSRVHYGHSYDNAFWDDTCFCMTYGDGAAFKSLEAVDVTGHEISHGGCASSAQLEYSGESGGLNESSSDIFGTLAEYYARGGGFAVASETLPETGGDWTIAEQLISPPLRYLYKPSKDGASRDAWSEDLGDQDVHYSSGPMNRCFFFLSQGASATAGDFHTAYLPKGMTGLGNDMAGRIWYRALTTYLISSSDYAAARAASIRAAQDLYGAGSPAEQAVWNAFHGINVGKAWGS